MMQKRKFTSPIRLTSVVLVSIGMESYLGTVQRANDLASWDETHFQPLQALVPAAHNTHTTTFARCTVRVWSTELRTREIGGLLTDGQDWGYLWCDVMYFGSGYECFGRTCCFHIQFCPENWGINILRNVCTSSPKCTALHPRRFQS